MLYRILTGRMEPLEVAAVLIALVFGISIHEFAHAAAATWLGDTLPRRQGRLTLAPLAHLDVVGSLMFLVGGFGWGKPVQYDPYALRIGLRYGPALVSVAGPVSNIILAVCVAILLRALEFLAPSLPILRSAPAIYVFSAFIFLLAFLVLYNLMLALFNLIPIYPLDGFTVLQALLPPDLAYRFEQTRQWGLLLLFALLFLGSNVMNVILYRPVFELWQLLVGGGF